MASASSSTTGRNSPEHRSQIFFRAHYMEVTRVNRPTTLSDLNDLSGIVEIHDPNTALLYVRLRTSLGTWDAIHDGKNEVEIVDQAARAQLPTYGLNTQAKETHSGHFGILSHAAYFAGGFSPAEVQIVNGGFTIRRWTYGGYDTIDFIEEKVSLQGNYRRSILIHKQAPKLPGTDWWLPILYRR